MKNLRALLAIAISLMFAACEVTPPQGAQPNAGVETQTARTRAASFASAPPDRPGLGTRWGERRTSLVGTSSFERANFNHPFAVGAIYYNDEAGIRAMAGTVAGQRSVPILADPAGRW